MRMRDFDYFADKPTHCGGMARIATIIRDIRRNAQKHGDVVIALDNGDSLQGTPLEETALRDLDKPHVFYRALKLMGFDAAGLGNHDFNFGLDPLVASIKNAPIEILCTNAHRVDSREFPVERWTVLHRELDGTPIRIGVFSVLPPQTVIWDADHLSGNLIVDDIMASARIALAALRSQGCDVVICLAHTGLGECDEQDGQENALWPLSRLDGLDAIIAGHTHLTLPDPGATEGSDLASGVLNGTPIIMPGSGGSHVGILDLDLRRTETGWEITRSRTRLRGADAPEDDELSNLTAPMHQTTRDYLAQRVGHSPLPLHSYFSFIAASPALALVAAAQAHAVRKHISRVADMPLLSGAAPSKLGGRGGPESYLDIPAGPLSLRHVFDLCFFPNRLAAVIVTGAQLADWIEMSAGIYNQISADRQDQVLFDPQRPAHSSDVIYGVKYELDLSQPARFDAQGQLVGPGCRRLQSLEHRGRKITPDDRFIVALSSYRANGGGNVQALKSAERLDVPNLLVRDALRDYLRDGNFPDFAQERPFRFRPLGQTRVSAPTGPGAIRFLDEVKDMCQEVSDADALGFLQLQLTL